MLPTFLIIGAQKAGTTSLHRYLGSHPEVFVSAVKEVRFFSSDENWERGVDWYEGHFAGAENALAAGEASPFYTMYPLVSGVPERIAQVIPDVRLVYLIRDPVARMRSQYIHLRGTKEERRDIATALLEDPKYLFLSRYAEQIERYLPHFDRSQLLVLRSEDLRHRRGDVLAEVYRFIGVDDGWVSGVEDREFHGSASGRPRSLVATVQRVPGYRGVARLARSVFGTEQVDRLKYRRVAETETVISPELERELRRRLAPDTARLEEYLRSG